MRKRRLAARLFTASGCFVVDGMTRPESDHAWMHSKAETVLLRGFYAKLSL